MAPFGRDKTRMPTTEEMLAGRARAMPVAATHAVLGTPTQPPFPSQLQTLIVGMGCFWGAERLFWQAEGVYTTAVGYAGGGTPNPTYEEVCSGRTGHTEAVLVVFDPAVIDIDALLRIFWENHDPTQGMRQGNDVGTQYRSAIYTADESQRQAAERSRDQYGPVLAAAGHGRYHHRDRNRAALLLRRGLPPAVPGQEPVGLLRHRRNRPGPAGGPGGSALPRDAGRRRRGSHPVSRPGHRGASLRPVP